MSTLSHNARVFSFSEQKVTNNLSSRMENELSILMRHDLLYREEYTPQDSGTGMQARESDGWFETNFGRFFLLCGFTRVPTF